MYLICSRKFLARFILTALLTVFLFHNYHLIAFATAEELAAEAEARKLLPVQSDEIENWPTGPQTSAQAAILMEANTGIILYAKNIHEKLYPASTTKILTSLLAMENGNLDDMVSFSYEAVFSVPRDGSNMGMDAGESIPLEEALYGILVASANEVSNAVAEYVSGTISDFTDLMNLRAAELGCTDSHFVNANGLFDENHYTSAYDLAVISRAFFQNEMLCKISNTPRYHFEPTATQPDDFYKNNKHQLVTGEIAYEGILGGKTGYTDQSRQTLVTCAEKNGMKLICVVFKEESPEQFTDTVELFNYGFQNFQVLNVSENEDKFNIENVNFFQSDNDIFGNSKPILSIDTDSYVIVPNMANFSDLESTIDYHIAEDEHVAKIDYTYNSVYVGSAFVNLSDYAESIYQFEVINDTNESDEKSDNDKNDRMEQSLEASSESTKKEDDTIYINVKTVLIGILIFATFFICVFIIRAFIVNNHNSKRRKNRVDRKKHRRERIRSNFDDFDF